MDAVHSKLLRTRTFPKMSVVLIGMCCENVQCGGCNGKFFCRDSIQAGPNGPQASTTKKDCVSFEYATEADCPGTWMTEDFAGLGCLREVTAVATSTSTASSAAMLKPALTVMLMLAMVVCY